MRHLILVIALAASGAMAAPSYDYIDISAMGFGYTQGVAAPEDDGVGARFRSSVSFDDEWFWAFEAALIEYDASRGFMFKTGVGYAFPLDTMDIAVKLETGRIDFGPASGGGYSWDVQLRSATWDHFELNGHFGMANVDPVDSFLRYGVGMLWTPGESFGITLEYDLMTGDAVDVYAWAAGVRWAF